jgi:hypothetical protein
MTYLQPIVILANGVAHYLNCHLSLQHDADVNLSRYDSSVTILKTFTNRPLTLLVHTTVLLCQFIHDG